jgi:AP-3 complex subunit beta
MCVLLCQVVLAAATLYHALAPIKECPQMGKALVHMSRSYPELQYCILSAINTLAATRPSIFSPFVRTFYILQCDPVHMSWFDMHVLTRFLM